MDIWRFCDWVIVTAALINIVPAPAAAEMAGQAATPGVSAAQGSVTKTSAGEPKSFGATMQTLDKTPAGKPTAGAASSSAQSPKTAVTGPETTAQAAAPELTKQAPVTTPLPVAGLAGATELPDLSGLLELSGLPGEAVTPDLSAGIPLPDSGNTLPVVTALADLQPLAMNASDVQPAIVNPGMLQQAVADPTQVAVASAVAKPVMLESQQLTPDGQGRTPMPAIINTDEAAVPTSQPKSTLDQLLQTDSSVFRQAQSIIEPAPVQNELAAVSRGAVSADFAALVTESGSATFSQPATQAPVQFDQLLELPQFQNMRPLQPMADAKTFVEGLGQRLMVMSEGGVQSARMKLYPENLGTLDIKIHVEDDTARVWFSTPNSQAREALEAALPKLKELFAHQGMELVQADVGSDQDHNRAGERFAGGDDSYPGLGDTEADYLPGSMAHLGAVAVSKHSLDIYV